MDETAESPDNSSPSDRIDRGRPKRSAISDGQVRSYALFALTAILIGLSALLAVPFLPALTWGIALAILAWPLHQWISRFVAHPTVAAALSSALIVVLILGLGFFVSYQLAREAEPVAKTIQSDDGGGAIRQNVDDVPVVGRVVNWMERVGLDVEGQIRSLIASYFDSLSGLAQGSVAAIVQFLVAVFILFYLFRDRATFMNGLRDLLPLSRSESDQVFSRAADSVHANLYATFITSTIDATSGGFMFWLCGLPMPVLWAVVMFVLSVLPVVGAGLVWVPAAVYLAITGHWIAACALLAWGILTFLIVDTIIYVRLAGPRMRMHDVPALIAFLGGLAVFGMSGMILGPAIFAITMALLEIWKSRIKTAPSEASS